MKPFDFGIRIARPVGEPEAAGIPAGLPVPGVFTVSQGCLFDLGELVERTERVFVDGAYAGNPAGVPGNPAGVPAPPARWQGNLASWGCALSHRAAIELARERKSQRTVIFEADAEPGYSLSHIVATIQSALHQLDQRDPRWGVLYLGGYFPKGSRQILLDELASRERPVIRRDYPRPEFTASQTSKLRALTLPARLNIPARLVQTSGVMLLHAYALSPVGLSAAAEVCERVIHSMTMWPYGHVDVAMCSQLHSLCSIYALDPWLFGQSEHISELTGKLCKRPIDVLKNGRVQKFGG